MSGHWVDWRDRAACVGENPELFFPIASGPRAAGQIAEAKAVCARCPVIERCLQFAAANGYEGVWGGLDDAERRRFRHHRYVTHCNRAASG